MPTLSLISITFCIVLSICWALAVIFSRKLVLWAAKKPKLKLEDIKPGYYWLKRNDILGKEMPWTIAKIVTESKEHLVYVVGSEQFDRLSRSLEKPYNADFRPIEIPDFVKDKEKL